MSESECCWNPLLKNRYLILMKPGGCSKKSEEDRKVHSVFWVVFGACLVAFSPSLPLFLDFLFSPFLRHTHFCLTDMSFLPTSSFLHSYSIPSETFDPINPLPHYKTSLFIHSLSPPPHCFCFCLSPSSPCLSSQFSSLFPLELRLVCR